MVDLALAVILLFGFLIGLRRGFILQLIHLAGFAAAFIAAYLYYDELAPKLDLWIPYPSLGNVEGLKLFLGAEGIESAYYNAIAFSIIFFGARILLQMVGSMLDFVAYLPILKQLNRWGGALLGFAEVYLIIFILLYIAALLPVSNVQSLMDSSILAELIVKQTPFLSDKVNELWFQYGAS